MKLSDTRELLALAQAARRYGLAPDSLKKYAQKSRLEAVKLGRNWFTTDKAVRKYLKQRDVARIPKRYRK